MALGFSVLSHSLAAAVVALGSLWSAVERSVSAVDSRFLDCDVDCDMVAAAMVPDEAGI